MERNARIILVSVFLLLTVAGAFIFYDWITSSADEETAELRLVQFNGSVSGLSIGSEVRYLGVPVGRVSSIRLAEGQSGRVNVELGARQKLPAAEELVAVLEAQGITGLSIIEMRDRRDDEKVFHVPEGAIPGFPSLFTQLSDSAGNITESAAQTLARINLVLDAKTIDNLHESIAQIRILTTNLAETSGQLDELTLSITRLSTKLEGTMPEYHAFLKNLNSEVLPAVAAAGNAVRDAGDSVSGSLGEDGEFVAQLMNKELPTLIGMTNDLSLTLRQLNETLENISDEPGSLLYGERLEEVEISLE